MRTALAEFGYHFTYEQLIFSFGMPGRRALAKLSIPAERVEPIMARWEALAYDRLDEIPMYDGIPEVIAELRNGGCQCGIVTSRTRLQLEQGIKPIASRRGLMRSSARMMSSIPSLRRTLCSSACDGSAVNPRTPSISATANMICSARKVQASRASSPCGGAPRRRS
ncbi:hypothetical protein DXB06_04540 [Butyricicoccus sp. OF13-6]|nr:HAD hydrolase-like protein [Butyricicoccus sp. OF13-6]RHV75812.1 hypothetical protein DXB06_04540 [Butyricicoccus sp. OF13-6]